MEEEKRYREDEKEIGPDSGLEPPVKPIDQADLSEEEGMREFPEETLCPSCGRFVGAYEKCPYCGAELKKRMSLIMWKRIAVGGTILGLLLMWFAATQMSPTEIQIGEIQETYNNANVSITGIVVGRIVKAKKNGFNMEIADKSGKIRAQNYGGLKKFQDAGTLPRIGDKITAIGSIQISAEWGTSLSLNSPHEIKILESEPAEEVELAELSEDWGNEKAIVVAAVKHAPRFGKATITDGVNDLTVMLDERNLGEDIPELTVGEGVEVTGVILSTDEGFAIVPGDVSDIDTEVEYTLGIPRRKIKDLSRKDMKKLVEVEGTVVGFKPFKTGGGAVKISDGTGRIEISPLFSSIFDKIPQSHLLKVNGTRVRARGEVGMFRDNLQIQPGSAENVEILETEDAR